MSWFYKIYLTLIGEDYVRRSVTLRQQFQDELNKNLTEFHKKGLPKIRIPLGAIKIRFVPMWEVRPWAFALFPIDQVKTGWIGELWVPYYRLRNPKTRKLTALYMAAEFMLYYQLANHPWYFYKIHVQWWPHHRVRRVWYIRRFLKLTGHKEAAKKIISFPVPSKTVMKLVGVMK